MNLKNAAAVCLISLFSATLVVLIARSLDSQAASQLEPQLTQIAEELRAIRRQGATARAGDTGPREDLGDALVVYCFHANVRCTACETMESLAKETLETDFAVPLRRGEIVWKVLNYEKPSGAVLAVKFGVAASTIVLARMHDNQVQCWKSLDEALALAEDEWAFRKYLGDGIKQMLAAGTKPASTAAIPTAKTAPAKTAPTTPAQK